MALSKTVLNYLKLLIEVNKKCRNMTKEEENTLKEFHNQPEVLKKYSITRKKLDF